MSPFETYFTLGMDHISDLNGYDHILFLVALCATYRISEWKRILILVTAFTIGHSITLALAALNIFPIPRSVIEFLIPATIFITCLYNVIGNREQRFETHRGSAGFNYIMALFFGLIHGMGFSSYFQALLGKGSNIVQPLFAFNIGLEVGQLMIVGIIFVFLFLALNVLKIRPREWNLFISGAAAGISLILMSETKFW